MVIGAGRSPEGPRVADALAAKAGVATVLSAIVPDMRASHSCLMLLLAMTAGGRRRAPAGACA